MKQIGFSFQMSPDAESLKIETTLNREPVVWGEFSAAETSRLIDALRANRLKFSEEVTRDLDPGAMLHVVVHDPMWIVRRKDNAVTIDLRDPTVGWTRFVLPPETAVELANALTDNARAQ